MDPDDTAALKAAKKAQEHLPTLCDALYRKARAHVTLLDLRSIPKEEGASDAAADAATDAAPAGDAAAKASEPAATGGAGSGAGAGSGGVAADAAAAVDPFEASVSQLAKWVDLSTPQYVGCGERVCAWGECCGSNVLLPHCCRYAVVAVERHIRRQNFGTALEAVNKIMSKGEVSVLVFGMKAIVSSRCIVALVPFSEQGCSMWRAMGVVVEAAHCTVAKAGRPGRCQ